MAVSRHVSGPNLGDQEYAAAAVALAWTTRSGNVIAICESGSAAHVKENAVALSLTLTSEDLQTLDAAHPPPSRYVLESSPKDV